MVLNKKSVLLSALLAGILVGCGGSGSNDTAKQDTNKQDKFVVVKPKALIDANFDEIGKNKTNATEVRALNYEEDIQKMVTLWNSPDTQDNYIRGFDYKNGKLAVASVYHNALVVYDENSHGFSPFAALEGAGDKKDGISVDGVTQASENWLNQVTFDSSGENIYALVKAKYFGWFSKGKHNPDKASNGIYKVKVDANNKVKIDKNTPFANRDFYAFDIFNNGNIIAHDNEKGDFYIYDSNLKEKSSFNIPNSFRYDMKNDKLVVLVKDQKTKKGYIQAFDPTNGTALGEKSTYDFSSDQNSLFELSDDGSKLLTYYDESGVSKVCAFDVSNFASQCGNFGKNYKKAIGSISPDGKRLALNVGAYNYEVSVINIENKPYLETFVPSKKDSMGIKFIDNNSLVFAEDERKIKEFKLSKDSSKNTIDEKFQYVSNKIFKIVSKDINNIKVKERIRGGKKSVRGDLYLPTNVDGINATWSISENFKDYISEQGKLLKVPTQKISGQISVKLQMQKDGKVIKEEVKQSTISLIP